MTDFFIKRNFLSLQKNTEEKSTETLMFGLLETIDAGIQPSMTFFSDDVVDEALEKEVLFQDIETQVSESLALLSQEPPR